MTTIFDRIRKRLAALGLSQRRASLDGGLSADGLGKVLQKRDQSPTLDTVSKLAKGLRTSPEWLAYGIGAEEIGEQTALTPTEICDPASSALLPALPDRRAMHDNSHIQVATSTLHQFVSGALQNESIPQEQADAYADAVLELIRGRASAHVVLRLEEAAHTAAVSQGPASAGRS